MTYQGKTTNSNKTVRYYQLSQSLVGFKQRVLLKPINQHTSY